MAQEETKLWTTAHLYGRRWRDTAREAAWYRALVADWPGVPAPPAEAARAAVRRYAGGDDVARPYTAETPPHSRCEVYCLASDDTPVGAIWGTVRGTAWMHHGQAIMPAHRGRRYSLEAGEASVNLFFAEGGAEVLTDAIVPALSERVKRAWADGPIPLEEREGIVGPVWRIRIDREHLARLRASRRERV